MIVKYKDIIEAKEILQLPEKASMETIRSNYRELINRWHPDKCKKDQEECNEMTKKIISAYKVILTYCSQYQYSFEEEEVRKYLSDEDWWFERFGDDPLWGSVNKP